MKRSCRFVLLAFVLTSLTSGCASFWHDLQPHRIRRLNRGAAPELSPEFTQSIRPGSGRLVKLERPRMAPAIKANCAEVTLARGQNLDD